MKRWSITHRANPELRMNRSNLVINRDLPVTYQFSVVRSRTSKNNNGRPVRIKEGTTSYQNNMMETTREC